MFGVTKNDPKDKSKAGAPARSPLMDFITGKPKDGAKGSASGGSSLMDFFKGKPNDKPKGPPAPPKPTILDAIKNRPRDKWIQENVKFYRSLGFFADIGKLKEKDLYLLLKKYVKPDVVPTREFDGLGIVEFDMKRVWRRKPVVIGDDRGFYLRALDEWSIISRGILRPLKTSLEFNHASGRQSLIQFIQDDMLYSMYVDTNLEHWLDHAIFDQLNEIFSSSGFRFEAGDLPDGSKVVVVVTQAEKQKLVNEKNWRFYT